MRGSPKKTVSAMNGRPADISETGSVLPNLPSLSLQLSGDDSMFDFSETSTKRHGARTADDMMRRRGRNLAGGKSTPLIREIRSREAPFEGLPYERRLKTSMSSVSFGARPSTEFNLSSRDKIMFRRSSRVSPHKMKRFSQISQENLWDPRYLMGCKIPVGVRFDTWPTKGYQQKPALLEKLESFVHQEVHHLSKANTGVYKHARFEVFQRLFEVFITEFRTYGHLLKATKDEYEEYIGGLQREINRQETMKAKLETFERNAERQRKMAHARAFIDLSKSQTKVNQLICENQDLRAKLNEVTKLLEVRTRKVEVLEFWNVEKEKQLVTAERDILNARNTDLTKDLVNDSLEQLKLERNRAFERIEALQAALEKTVPKDKYDNCLSEIKRLRAEAGVSLVARRMDHSTFAALSKLAEKISEDDTEDGSEESVVEKILSVANSRVLKALDYEDICGILQGELTIDDISQELELRGISDLIKKTVKVPVHLAKLKKCVDDIGVSAAARLVGDRNTISLVKLVLSGALAALPQTDARSVPSTPGNFNDFLKNRFRLGKMGALEGLMDPSQIAVLKYRLHHERDPAPEMMNTLIANEKDKVQKLTCKELFVALLSHSDVLNTFIKCTGSSLEELEAMEIEKASDFANIMSSVLQSDALIRSEKKAPAASTKKVGDYSRDAYFVDHGMGNNVPKYLRTNGKIRNRKLIKATAEGMVKEAWREKMKWGQEMLMEDFFYAFLQKKFGLQSMIVEWGYNLINALKKYSYDADCELFLKILTGQIGEEVYMQQMKMIDDYKKQLIAADMSAGGKVIGRLPKREFMTVTKEFFNKKSVEQFETLWECLEQDQQGDWVMYDLLFEEDRSGDQGQFVEEIRDQFLAEREMYLSTLEEALITAMGTTSEDPYADMITLEQARIGILTADINCDYATLNMYLRKGFEVGMDQDISSANVESVTLDTLMRRIKTCSVQRAPSVKKAKR